MNISAVCSSKLLIAFGFICNSSHAKHKRSITQTLICPVNFIILFV